MVQPMGIVIVVFQYGIGWTEKVSLPFALKSRIRTMISTGTVKTISESVLHHGLVEIVESCFLKIMTPERSHKDNI